MKLLLYSRDWMPSIGGVEIISKSLADGLADYSRAHPEEGVQVTLLTQTPAGGSDDSLLPYRVIRKPTLGEWFRQTRLADIVQLEGPSLLPLTLTWLLRKPVVLRHHGYQSICPNGILLFGSDRSVCPGHFMARRYNKCLSCNSTELGLLGSLRGLLLTFPRRWLARRATVNVGVSPHIAMRLALPRAEVIWNGVSAPEIPAASSAIARGGAPVRFAYVGRLITEKGLPILLRACRVLKDEGVDFRLIVVGGGPEQNNLVALTTELHLGERVEFTGPVATTAIQKTIEGVAAVIMPSVCEDVAPLTAIEQMMEGRLVIASDIGGLGLMIDKFGAKFPAGDVRALASCMRQVIADPTSAKELGMQGRQHALKMFTKDRMVNQHLQVYRRLTQKEPQYP